MTDRQEVVQALEADNWQDMAFDFRKSLLRTFCWFKRLVRRHLAERDALADQWRWLTREKALLEARSNPFDVGRIQNLASAIKQLGDRIGGKRHELADLGGRLVELCEDADALFSDHDKAQVMGVSLTRMQNAIRAHGDPRDKDRTKLFQLIFVDKIEHHHSEADFITPRDGEMPLWEAASAHIMQWLETPEGKKATEGTFERFFSGVPVYETYTGPDGVQRFRRRPPKLAVVK